jgi:hypothetical protein
MAKNLTFWIGGGYPALAMAEDIKNDIRVISAKPRYSSKFADFETLRITVRSHQDLLEICEHYGFLTEAEMLEDQA